MLASVCYSEKKVKLWDVKCGVSISVVSSYVVMHSGTLLQDMPFMFPGSAIFLNHSSTKLIVACYSDIFIVNVSTQSTQPFIDTQQDERYFPHALALSDDDAVLVAGCAITKSVCGYDTVSLAKLWIHDTASFVCAVCMLGAHVLVTVHGNPTLVLDCNTGALVESLQKADGSIIGLGVIEGLCFIVP